MLDLAMDADRCVMTPAPARLQSQRPPPFTEWGVELLQRAWSGNTVKTEHRSEQHIASCDTGHSLDADSLLSSIASRTSVLSSDQIAAVVVNLLTSFTVSISRVLLLPPNLLHHSRGTWFLLPLIRPTGAGANHRGLWSGLVSQPRRRGELE